MRELRDGVVISRSRGLGLVGQGSDKEGDGADGWRDLVMGIAFW